MKIPEIRKELLDIAGILEAAIGPCDLAARVRGLEKELYRRPPVRKSKPQQRSLTPALRAEIKQYAEAFPDETYMTIGRVFNVNSGRVSEAVAGHRA